MHLSKSYGAFLLPLPNANKLGTEKGNYLSHVGRKFAEELRAQVFWHPQSITKLHKGFAYPENSSQFYVWVRKAWVFWFSFATKWLIGNEC